MAISLVAHTVQSGNNPTTSAIDTTGASLLLVGLSCFTTSDTPTDSKGNTWHSLTVQGTGGNGLTQLWYAWNPSVGSGHTFSGNTNTYGMTVAAFSGIQTSSDPLDVQNGTTQTTAVTSTNTGSITPSASGELVFSYIGGNQETGGFSIDSSLTITDQEAFISGTRYGQAMAYLVQAIAAAINPSWSWLPASPTGTTIAAFKAGSGGGSTSPVARVVFIKQAINRASTY